MQDKRHYFNTLLPTIPQDEEEIFYRHPTLPLQCNQIGIVFLDDSVTESSWSRESETMTLNVDGVRIARSRFKLILECYTGNEGNFGHLRNLDGDFYNTTPENMVYGPERREEAILATDEYIKNSVLYMREKEHWIRSQGIDVALYWSHIKLPQWLAKAYTKLYGKEVKFKTRVINKTETPKPKKEKPQEVYHNKVKLDKLTREMRELYSEGWTLTRIAEKYGVSRTLASYYLKRRIWN